MINLLILGNGLDIGLGMKTSINEFLKFIKNISNQILKSKFKLSQKNINCFKDFKDSYENWCISMNKENNYWNNLENNIVDFFSDFEENFQTFKQKCKKRWNKNNSAYSKLRTGYEIFTFLMQFYYVNEIKTKISNQEGKKIHHKIKRLEEFFNTKVNLILSLNYTNIKDFFHSNTKEKFNIKPNIYYLHYITIGLIFDKYLQNLKQKKDFLNYANFGDAKEIFNTKNIKISKELRKKYIIPHSPYSLFCTYCKRNLTGIKRYYQFLILGNTNTKKNLIINKYNFLEKNYNENLFLKNYPNFILEEIKNNFDKNKYSSNNIYIFGFSFGSADYVLNKFFANELIKKDWTIKYVFFEEDKTNKTLLNDNMIFFNNFCKNFNLSLSFKNLEQFISNVYFI